MKLPKVIKSQNLHQARLYYVDARNSTFVDLDLSNSFVCRSDLAHARFIRCNLEGARFYDCETKGIEFVGCSMPDFKSQRMPVPSCDDLFEEFGIVITRNGVSRPRSCGEGFEPLHLWRNWSWRGPSSSRLCGLVTEADDVVPPTSWRLSELINSGEKKQLMENFEHVHACTLERSQSADLQQSLKMGGHVLLGIENKLNAAFSSRDVVLNREQTSRGSSRCISLPAEPSDPDRLCVRSRAYFWAPVQRRLRLYITTKRPWQKGTFGFVTTLLQPTGEIVTKQIDYRNDGSERVLPTARFWLWGPLSGRLV